MNTSPSQTPTTYHKFCKLCKKPFTSTARNAKYCDNADEKGNKCLDKAREIMRGRGKRRTKYEVNKTELRKESMSRKQGREEAINRMVAHRCERCGEPHFLANLELHHIDSNPHNNPKDGTNWSFLMEKCHHAAQAEIETLLKQGKQWVYEKGTYRERLPTDPPAGANGGVVIRSMPVLQAA